MLEDFKRRRKGEWTDWQARRVGAFARKHLFVTPHSDKERYPAGEYTVQGSGTNGLPDWMSANRNVKGEDVVLWHAFGVTHVPRPEDFPVMPYVS